MTSTRSFSLSIFVHLGLLALPFITPMGQNESKLITTPLFITLNPSSPKPLPPQPPIRKKILTSNSDIKMKSTNKVETAPTTEFAQTQVHNTTYNLGSSSNIETPLSRYLSHLRQKIEEKKIYPTISRRLGEKGQVLISVKLLKSGIIENAHLKTKSSYPRLDQAALNTVLSVEKYPSFPNEILQEHLLLEIPVEFTL